MDMEKWTFKVLFLHIFKSMLSFSVCVVKLQDLSGWKIIHMVLFSESCGTESELDIWHCMIYFLGCKFGSKMLQTLKTNKYKNHKVRAISLHSSSYLSRFQAADASLNWVRGGIHPGQTESLSRGHIRDKQDKHLLTLSLLSRGQLKNTS